MTTPDDLAALLPLPPAAFHILVALADDDRHGYAIIQEVAARTAGEVTLSAGTLYRSIQRMLEQGLILETTTGAPRPSMTTSAGGTTASPPAASAAARAEARRLEQLVKLARAYGIAPARA